MKNILNEVPGRVLSGRLLASVQFVDDYDVKDKTVLDIGCGYGWCEINFLGRGAAKVVGVEVSEKDLETIRSNISNDRLELKASSATSLPFEANSFDSIVSWEVVEHIPKGTEGLMLAEVARVLRPGGAFYLSTPHRSFFTNLLDPAWWLVGHRHYSSKQLEEFANDTAILRVESVKIRGGWWSLVNILNLYISKWIFRRKPFLESFLNEMENAEYANEDAGFSNIFMKFRKSR